VQLNQDEGVALVVVTHALDLARRMHRTFELRDGKLQPRKHRERSGNCSDPPITALPTA
jgi:ABC-type lipoprotein export system ATPase subunit